MKKIKTKCGMCGGSGQEHNWNENRKPVQYIVTDCKACNGSGQVEVELVDQRNKSRKKECIEPISY